MKKLIALACFACMGYAAQAQSAGSPAIDTLTDANTITIAQPNSTYFNNNMSGTWSVALVATKIDGTTAGKIYLDGSIDGVNYVVIDSLTLANVSGAQVKNIYISNKRVVKAQVRGVGSGTQNTQVKTSWAKGN